MRQQTGTLRNITTNIALIGGGASPQPGEISLAHNGVLFLDELPEFSRKVLEVLRQPLEEREVFVSRANYRVVYPSDFILVAAMNPCPCGYFNHPGKSCSCGAGTIKRYMARISGPLMDRIDMHIEVVPVPYRQLTSNKKGVTSDQMLLQVINARRIQQERFKSIDGITDNAHMHPALRKQFCILDREGKRILRTATEKLKLSARAFDRILKLARTIADLEESKNILPAHVSEAVTYRKLDREEWGV